MLFFFENLTNSWRVRNIVQVETGLVSGDWVIQITSGYTIGRRLYNRVMGNTSDEWGNTSDEWGGGIKVASGGIQVGSGGKTSDEWEDTSIEQGIQVAHG